MRLQREVAFVHSVTTLRYEVVDVTDKNVDHIGLFCQKSKSKEEGYKNKLAWFKEQYKSGLRTTSQPLRRPASESIS